MLGTLGRLLLLPFSLIYGLGVLLRNFLFFLGVLRERKFDIPTIGIGNLAVGGTGKTPLVEYMIATLQEDGLLPAVVSRGYKGSADGVVVLSENHTAQEVGDEPQQIKRKFPGIPVIVGKSRVAAIQRVEAEMPRVDVVLLDDAFQHRYVRPGLNILTTPYSRPFTEDWLLPSGNLREPPRARKRADLIVVTKSLVVLSPFELGRLKEKLRPWPYQSLYFSYLQYKQFVDARTPAEQDQIDDFANYKLILFTGIADPSPLVTYLERKCKAVDLVKFADHKVFTEKAYNLVAKRYTDTYVAEKAVVTTEKDIRRLESLPAWQHFQQLPLYYLPMEVAFHKNEEEPSFDERIIRYVRANQRNRPLHSGTH